MDEIKEVKPTEVKQEIKVEEKPAEAVSKPKEDKVEENFKPIEIPQENWRTSPLFYEIASYLNVEDRDYEKAAEKISLITEWAIQKANSNKTHDILPIIRELEDAVMKPSWGETRYTNLYRYIRLAIKRDAFDKALSAFKVKK